MLNLANNQLKRLSNDSLSKQERAGLAYKITSTEKIVAKAPLGVCGFETVSITGKGKMERTFAEELGNTLIQPDRTDVAEPVGGMTANPTTLQLYGEGNIDSVAYERMSKLSQKATRPGCKPYATPCLTAEYTSQPSESIRRKDAPYRQPTGRTWSRGSFQAYKAQPKEDEGSRKRRAVGNCHPTYHSPSEPPWHRTTSTLPVR